MHLAMDFLQSNKNGVGVGGVGGGGVRAVLRAYKWRLGTG